MNSINHNAVALQPGSADWQSAVSRIGNPQTAARNGSRRWAFGELMLGLPGRLPTCALNSKPDFDLVARIFLLICVHLCSSVANP
jgi:hypothetical protein